MLISVAIEPVRLCCFERCTHSVCLRSELEVLIDRKRVMEFLRLTVRHSHSPLDFVMKINSNDVKSIRLHRTITFKHTKRNEQNVKRFRRGVPTHHGTYRMRCIWFSWRTPWHTQRPRCLFIISLKYVFAVYKLNQFQFWLSFFVRSFSHSIRLTWREWNASDGEQKRNGEWERKRETLWVWKENYEK